MGQDHGLESLANVNRSESSVAPLCNTEGGGRDNHLLNIKAVPASLESSVLYDEVNQAQSLVEYFPATRSPQVEFLLAAPHSEQKDLPVAVQSMQEEQQMEDVEQGKDEVVSSMETGDQCR